MMTAKKRNVSKKHKPTKTEIEQAAHAEHSKVLLAAEDARLEALAKETPQEAKHHYWEQFKRFLLSGPKNA
jgi:hypothetical protein